MAKDTAYIVAIDSFKGCMDTLEANEAARQGLIDAGVEPERIHCFPVSDGGEGFESVVPREEGTAFIESARHCGYNQLSKGVRDPHLYSSYALGLRIAEEAKHAKKIVIGLGGTCTVDAGIGMLQALGAKIIVNENGIERLLEPDEPALEKPIVSIDISNLTAVVQIEAWSDTRSPLCGPDGAVIMYGPQKGLAKDALEGAEKWMEDIAKLYTEAGSALPSDPGCGAAGGIGAALHCILGAEIKSGAEQIIAHSGMLETIRQETANGREVTVITGEGRLDRQTATGKLPAVIASAAKAAGATRTICVCGSDASQNNEALASLNPIVSNKHKAASSTEIINEATVSASTSPDPNRATAAIFDQVIQITPAGMPLEEAMKAETAQANLRKSLAAQTNL